MPKSNQSSNRWTWLIGVLAAASWFAADTGQVHSQDGGALELAKSALRDPDPQLRLAALEWLQYQWRGLRSELQAELRGGRKEQVELLLQAQRALAQQADRVADLVLRDPSEQVRLRAIETLALLQPDVRQEKVQEAWRILLDSAQPEWALAGVRAWGVLFESAVADLTNPRLETAESLRVTRQLAQDLSVLSELLRRALTHSEVAVRAATLRVLNEVFTAVVQRLSGLQAQLGLPEFRPLAKDILTHLLHVLRQVHPPLQDCLSLPHVSVRQPACQLCETWGDLVQLLRDELQQPDGGQFAEQFQRALAPGLADLLTIALSDRSVGIRLSALQAVEAIEPLSSRTWPALLQALDDTYAPVRWTAARCLEAARSVSLSEAERSAIVRGLAQCLAEEPEVSVRLRLAHSLRSWRSELLAARSELAQALLNLARPWPGIDFAPFAPAHRQSPRQVRDQDVLLALLIALREFAEHHRRTSHEPLPAEWLNGLILALDAEKPAVRVEACRTLGHYGAAAYVARPVLIRLLKDSDPQVRGAAAQALLRITPPPQ
ncbi:MAG: HEAT repeat domain-containing protein [Gemmatales bacterium]|nr:HEAT repeat domain-containing protein [Gemmatales bacterium]MDW8223957.1 HEAT repeat domain-containing protein [Gemmatales bacterium]